jgi:hypothetical protein
VRFINEILINVVLIFGIIYIILYIVRFYRYNLHYRIHQTSFSSDHIYHKIMLILNDVDIIESRKEELRDAPNKLCNQNCNTRHKFLIKIFEENGKILNHIQTCLLIQLRDEFNKLNEKYAKDYQKILSKYNLPDTDIKWVPNLHQYG